VIGVTTLVEELYRVNETIDDDGILMYHLQEAGYLNQVRDFLAENDVLYWIQ